MKDDQLHGLIFIHLGGRFRVRYEEGQATTVQRGIEMTQDEPATIGPSIPNLLGMFVLGNLVMFPQLSYRLAGLIGLITGLILHKNPLATASP